LIVHRGPDGEGSWVDSENSLFMGHRRLSIVDHSGGVQPMFSADKRLCITFNGEIYNHAALRKELENLGHRFKSNHSDTEVLLYGYLEWGAKLEEHLNGMWAFVIYDRKEKKIFASRDRFGEKPFYYYLGPKLFAWSSELKSLVSHPHIKTSISKKALQKYFGYGYIPSPLSIYENVFKLSPGHNLTLDLSSWRLQIKSYWEFVLDPVSHPKNAEKALAEELHSLLKESVKIRMIADVPVGVFLSGGVDSSAVSALAVENFGRDQVKTFSVGFDDPNFDESRFAQQVSTFLGTQHFNEKLTADQAKVLASQLFDKIDEPMADSSIIPTYLLNHFAVKNVKVALGGDGADELFAGYAPFKALSLAQKYSAIVPHSIHEGIRAAVSFLPVSHNYMSLDFKIKRTLKGLSFAPKFWFPTWMAPLEPGEISELMNSPVSLEETYSEVIAIWEKTSGRPFGERFLALYTGLYLSEDILPKVDRASMQNSLEVRSPFLDINLVNFVRKLPWNLKYRHGQSKYLLKQALKNHLPPETLKRKKQGFAMPIGKWLKENQTNFASDFSSLPYINSNFANKFLSQHRQGESDHRLFLWSLQVYRQWHQANPVAFPKEI
jgi:asparagine synthase (glutamine-hydrolysing)